MSVVLTRFASLRIAVAGVEGIRIGLGGLPNLLAGVVLGPAYGALSGAASDIIGFMLSPMGGYMPHFTLSAAVFGALPGLVLRARRNVNHRSEIPALRLALAILSGTVSASWILTPYFLQTLFGLDYRVILPPRILASLVEIPVYTAITRSVWRNYARMERPPGKD
jgi:ECF transporter S component (folate family)